MEREREREREVFSGKDAVEMAARQELTAFGPLYITVITR